MAASQQPLPEVGDVVLFQEAPGLGFAAIVQHTEDPANIRLQLDCFSPPQTVSVTCDKIHALGEALEEGWFPRWEFRHDRDGWRQYALSESYLIEAAHSQWRAKEPGAENFILVEGGGKLNQHDHLISFEPCERFLEWPHVGTQTNKATGNERPVRRTLRDAASVSPGSQEGWCLRFGSLPINVVCDIWQEVADNSLEESRALATLQAMIYRSRIADLPEGNERVLARLRFSGPHIDAFAAEQEEPSVIVWEWFHGGERREWKAYRGAESELLERRHEAQAKHALINGGKPAEGWPSKPLRVLFDVGWTSEGGKVFATHTQVDLVSRRHRGVRRQEASKGTWDFIFFCWLRTYPWVRTKEVYFVYDAYLRQISEGGSETYAQARAEAEARLAELQNASPAFRDPPQDEVPEAFICPIGHTLMLTPAYQAQNPATARMEKEALMKWVREKGTHPLTNEAMTTAEVLTDDELMAQMAEWLRTFVETTA